MNRRNFIALAIGAIAACHSTSTRAQVTTWPDRPVKVIVPFAAGGATDAIARPWIEEFSKAFGQPFVVENRAGASGMIGVESAVKATPDGYTLIMMGNGPLTILPSLKKVPYDPTKSLVPIGRAGDSTFGFVIHPSRGIKTMPELIEYAKKNPGKLAFASSGNGSLPHLRIEALKLKAGIDILHVPYRGGADALNDVLSGTVHMMNEPLTLPHAKAGKLVLLAINGPVRNPDFPDVATLTEAGIIGADVPGWFGLYGPASMPKEIVTRINAKMVELAKNDDFKKKLRSVNAIVPMQTPDEMARHIATDIKANLDIIKAAKVTIE